MSKQTLSAIVIDLLLLAYAFKPLRRMGNQPSWSNKREVISLALFLLAIGVLLFVDFGVVK